MTETNPQIWVLTDERTGHNVQSIGVARTLGLSFEEKHITHKKLSLSSGLGAIDRQSKDALTPPYPQIIIACGRRLAAVSRDIKARAAKQGVMCYNVQIMWPGSDSGFDLIAVPEHDNIPKKLNTISILTAPHCVTQDLLDSEGDMWGMTLKKSLGDKAGYPAIGVLIGGDNKHGKMSIGNMRNLWKMLSHIVQESGGSLLITTSRRTPVKAAEYLEGKVAKSDLPVYLHRIDKEPEKNPYYAILALSDALITTDDSISMISEAASAPAPVWVADIGLKTPTKFAHFRRKLYEMNGAAPLSLRNYKDVAKDIVTVDNVSQERVDSAGQIADRIRAEKLEFSG